MTVATDVDVAIVHACLARIITQEREAGAAEERDAIYELLRKIADEVEASQHKRPPPGYTRTTAAEWLRFAAADVARRGRSAHVQHEKNKAAEPAKEMNPHE